MPGPLAERPAERRQEPLLGLDHGHLHVGMGDRYRSGQLHTGRSSAHHGQPTGMFQRLTNADGIAGRAQGVGHFDALDRWSGRLGSGGDDDDLGVDRRTIGQGDRAVVERDHRLVDHPDVEQVGQRNCGVGDRGGAAGNRRQAGEELVVTGRLDQRQRESLVQEAGDDVSPRRAAADDCHSRCCHHR